MSVRDLLDRIAELPEYPPDQPVTPPPEVVGFFVRYVRGMRQWKQSTLADFATVSVSTIERVERGEKVAERTLDRITQALGYEPGYLTKPRLPLDWQETAEKVLETYGHLEAVPARPMNTHRSVREAADCHAYLIHRPDVPKCHDTDIAALIEWLDLAAFLLSTNSLRERGRRSLYNDILKSVRELEGQGLTVLSGFIAAPREGIPDWKVAIISITPKLSDPAAVKRSHVLVDRRIVSEQNTRLDAGLALGG